MEINTRNCSACEDVLTAENSVKWKAQCKKCIARYMKKYMLKKRFGLGYEDFNRMSEQQAGLCAICKERPIYAVDHDHKTGRVRELLCRECNLGLGNFQDNTEWIISALAYLHKHSE